MKKRIEIYMLAGVAIVSAWHVIIRFSDVDHAFIATVQGALLSFLLAYLAHSVAHRSGWQRWVAGAGLAVFAGFSAVFQTSYFLAHGVSLLESLARGLWAPAAETILGLLLVAPELQAQPAPEIAADPVAQSTEIASGISPPVAARLQRNSASGDDEIARLRERKDAMIADGIADRDVVMKFLSEEIAKNRIAEVFGVAASTITRWSRNGAEVK